MKETNEIWIKAKTLGITYNKRTTKEELEELISKAGSVEPVDNDEATLEDLMLTADDMGIKYQGNVTAEWLIEKIKAVQEENEADDDGEFFTAVDRPCFILALHFEPGTPYRLDEYSSNVVFMERFEAQIRAKTLEMI
ncbi:MAG: hypothetical protein ACTSWQ_10065 [Candidatus Thorarchaeota archaeon]